MIIKRWNCGQYWVVIEKNSPNANCAWTGSLPNVPNCWITTSLDESHPATSYHYYVLLCSLVWLWACHISGYVLTTLVAHHLKKDLHPWQVDFSWPKVSCACAWPGYLMWSFLCVRPPRAPYRAIICPLLPLQSAWRWLFARVVCPHFLSYWVDVGCC